MTEPFAGWPVVLGEVTAGRDLDPALAHAAMGEILAGDATPAQIAGFVVGLRMKGETVEELVALRQAMLDAAERITLPDDIEAVDTCGTGGDRAGTINVSSIAALVLAGGGVSVLKHGNRASSSQCGSADVYEVLGMAIDLGPEKVAASVVESGFGFAMAPRFHASMRHAGPTRKELGIPTAFNILGPIANPAGVRRQVVGVADPGVAEKLLRVLEAAGGVRALVVHGADGLDELTTTTTSAVFELREGAVSTYEVDPTSFGLATAEPDDLLGGTADVNADAARRVLAGAPGPHRDIVVLNAAAGFLVADAAADLAEGVALAQAAIDDGRAEAKLAQVVELGTRLAAG
ncbi:MAG: anthranilate phosphoribosyltransferase [Acidimicrobiales bacterium]